MVHRVAWFHTGKPAPRDETSRRLVSYGGGYSKDAAFHRLVVARRGGRKNFGWNLPSSDHCQRFLRNKLVMEDVETEEMVEERVLAHQGGRIGIRTVVIEEGGYPFG